jgi:hypothetical protein
VERRIQIGITATDDHRPLMGKMEIRITHAGTAHARTWSVIVEFRNAMGSHPIILGLI